MNMIRAFALLFAVLLAGCATSNRSLTPQTKTQYQVDLAKSTQYTKQEIRRDGGVIRQASPHIGVVSWRGNQPFSSQSPHAVPDGSPQYKFKPSTVISSNSSRVTTTTSILQ
jgi:hypothetical protein